MRAAMQGMQCGKVICGVHVLPCQASSTPRWWKQGYGSPPDYHSPKDYQSPRYFKAAEADKPEAVSVGGSRSRPWCAGQSLQVIAVARSLGRPQVLCLLRDKDHLRRSLLRQQECSAGLSLFQASLTRGRYGRRRAYGLLNAPMLELCNILLNTGVNMSGRDYGAPPRYTSPRSYATPPSYRAPAAYGPGAQHVASSPELGSITFGSGPSPAWPDSAALDQYGRASDVRCRTPARS